MVAHSQPTGYYANTHPGNVMCNGLGSKNILNYIATHMWINSTCALKQLTEINECILKL